MFYSLDAQSLTDKLHKKNSKFNTIPQNFDISNTQAIVVVLLRWYGMLWQVWIKQVVV